VETFEPWSPERAQNIIAPLVSRDGALLPILRALQETFGHVPREAVALVAGALNLSRAEVHGVLTFYHDFRETPRGRRVVKLCRAESCQAMGAATAARFLLAVLGLPTDEPWGGTTADGAVTVEAVYCLGLCAVSPAALIDGEPFGRVDGMALAEAVGT
jgi:formate dehydrogenase subunit gamma